MKAQQCFKNQHHAVLYLPPSPSCPQPPLQKPSDDSHNSRARKANLLTVALLVLCCISARATKSNAWAQSWEDSVIKAIWHYPVSTLPGTVRTPGRHSAGTMQGDSPKALSKDIVLFSQQQYYSILTAGDIPTLALNLMHFPIKFLTALGSFLIISVIT